MAPPRSVALGDAGFGPLEVIRSKPNADGAMAVLRRVVGDPGIRAVMKKHGYRVGRVFELCPLEKPRLLGINYNHGEKIGLRLRRGGRRGMGDGPGAFMSHDDILATLCHELAHNEVGPHNAAFHALNRKLRNEAFALNWKNSHGHAAGGRPSQQPADPKRKRELMLAALNARGGWKFGKGHTLGGGGAVRSAAAARGGMSDRELRAAALEMRLSQDEVDLTQRCGSQRDEPRPPSRASAPSSSSSFEGASSSADAAAASSASSSAGSSSAASAPPKRDRPHGKREAGDDLPRRSAGNGYGGGRTLDDDDDDEIVFVGEKRPEPPAGPAQLDTASAQLLATVLINVCLNPEEPKYRRVNVSKLRARGMTDQAFNLLLNIGWQSDAADRNFLVLPEHADLRCLHMVWESLFEGAAAAGPAGGAAGAAEVRAEQSRLQRERQRRRAQEESDRLLAERLQREGRL